MIKPTRKPEATKELIRLLILEDEFYETLAWKKTTYSAGLIRNFIRILSENNLVFLQKKGRKVVCKPSKELILRSEIRGFITNDDKNRVFRRDGYD